VKDVQHPKFYLFDRGVVRALSHRLREPLDGSNGHLRETLVFNELRAHKAYTARCGFSIIANPPAIQISALQHRVDSRAIQLCQFGVFLDPAAAPAFWLAGLCHNRPPLHQGKYS
jgi:hypothetical protein